MGSHYIPVGKLKIDKSILDIVCPAAGYGETPPPPAIYCPINGYIPDPTKYVEDPEIEQIIEPGVGEISILVGNPYLQDKVRFKCAVSNSGKYNVFLYGANNTLLSTTLVNNNAYYDDFLPESGGIQNDGYQTFNLVIAPEIAGNHLTLFRIYKDSDFPDTKYIATYINAPELTTLADAFYQIPNLKVVEFLGDYNLLTNMHGCFEDMPDLLKVSMLGSFQSLEDMSYTFENTPLLQEVTFPAALPSVRTMSNAFRDSGVGEVVLPNSMPSLEQLENLFYGTLRLKSVVFPVSAPNLHTVYGIFNTSSVENAFNFPIQDAIGIVNLSSIAYSASNLKGDFIFPELQNCTTIQNAFRDAKNVNKVEFTGNMNLCNNIDYAFWNCSKIKRIVLPESLNGLSKVTPTSLINNCNELEYLGLPKYWNDTSTAFTNFTSAFLGGFTMCRKLKEISTMLGTNDSLMATLNQGDLHSLESFNQPNFRPYGTVNLTPKGASTANNIRGALSYFEVDWKYLKGTSLYLNYQKLPKNEILRIIDNLPNAGENATQNSIYFNIADSPGLLELNCKRYSLATGPGVSQINNLGPDDMTGYYVSRLGVNYLVSVGYNFSTNVFTTSYTHNFPVNKKIVFNHSTVEIGLIRNTDYYIVNPNNDTFQVAETPGGVPVSFSGDATVYISFSMQIIGMNGNHAITDCAILTNSYSTWFFSDSINFYELHKKGYVLNY